MITQVPVLNVIHDRLPGYSDRRSLLVMLPGAGDRAQDLMDQGFVQALRMRQLPFDVALVDVPMDCYLEYRVVEHLHQEIVDPAHAAGYDRIWLMGISLGGMAVLASVRQRPPGLAGAVLLAPFLGTRGLIAEVMNAGGLDHWRPVPADQHDQERSLIAWLKHARHEDMRLPPVYLGYGSDDRFADASELLSQRLPAEQVLSEPGGHDWATWLKLWQRMLALRIFESRI